MDKKVFGQRIKAAREKIGITKAELMVWCDAWNLTKIGWTLYSDSED